MPLEPRYEVIVSVRSKAKGDGIISALPIEFKENVTYAVVEDIAQDNAFDEVRPYVSLPSPFFSILHHANEASALLIWLCGNRP